jgi:hypothetical protein
MMMRKDTPPHDKAPAEEFAELLEAAELEAGELVDCLTIPYRLFAGLRRDDYVDWVEPWKCPKVRGVDILIEWPE